MEQLKSIKEQLIAQIQAQMNDLKCVDTKELGEVIDMVKDLAEAEYYCEIYEQMEEAKKKESAPSNNYYYTERYYRAPEHYRDMDRPDGRMYYSESRPFHKDTIYSERDYPLYIRDEREGRSPMKRKMYMESKTDGDAAKSIKELESYMQDLTSDMMDMLDKATPEEKAVVQKKISTLSTKLQNV